MSDDGREAVRRSMQAMGGLARGDAEAWLERLCDPEPWGELPDVMLPAWLDHFVWWDWAVPARVGIRHAQLRWDRVRDLLFFAGRHSQHPRDVEAFLRGAAESALPVEEAVDLLLRATDRVEVLRPLVEDATALARVRQAARGETSIGGAAARALELLLAHDDPELPEVLREASLATSSELRALASEQLLARGEAGAWARSQLGKGSADRRAHAAALAARAGGDEAVAALRGRLDLEKQEKVQVALLEGLERLGVDLTSVLDPDTLVASMTKAAAKGTRPKDLDLDALPTLRWKDGTEVPRALVDAWIATSHKRKQPVPTPMLSVLARGLEPVAAGDFALALFRFWVALDDTDTDPYWGHMKGTATADKGLFAVVAALADARIVPEVRTYVTTHYGWRSAQCKAMVAMLAHLAHPSGIQYLLQIAARFRTKGIKLAAREQTEQLAADRGWSPDELADRTLGDAGLDDEPFGFTDADGAPTRSFRLVLTEELAIQVADEEGQLAKGLPKARAGEDPASEKAAKARLSAARKELKAFLGVQIGRLRDAMLTQRAWSMELWRTVAEHPVMRALFRRLLWRCDDVVFRLDEDGRLVDAGDETVQLPDDASVRLAHAVFLSADVAATWGQHLADFEILPLFAQIGRPTWRPTDPAAESIPCGAEGEGRRLRGLTSKLGYELGPAQDGGYIDAFERDHPGIGLTVQLLAEGLRHPIDDTVVPLGGAVFLQQGRRVALGKVPAVLLSEVYADLEEIAQALA